jgi:phosphatidylinositol-3-phosphatase
MQRRLSVAMTVALSACLVGTVSARNGSATTPGVPRLAHVVVIVFENHPRGAILGSGSAPTFDRLAATYAQATAYEAVAHPSLPNYLALVSGSTHGVTTDCTNCPQTGPTIGSQLTAAHRSWTAYAEGYASGHAFAMKHVPFLYFAGERRHVVDLDHFDPRKLSSYSLVVPNLCHDMHDCSVATGDRWLADFIPPLLHLTRTAVFIAFDEGSSSRRAEHLPLLVTGSAVRPHSSFATPTTHYGLLRTVEASLGLEPLGLARYARPLTGIWR